MSHFYGTLQGNRGEATRCGSKSSGITTHAAGWRGAIAVQVYHDEDTGADRALITLTPWQGSGGNMQAIADIELNATVDWRKTYKE